MYLAVLDAVLTKIVRRRPFSLAPRSVSLFDRHRVAV